MQDSSLNLLFLSKMTIYPNTAPCTQLRINDMDSFTVAWEADKSSGHDFEVKGGNHLHMLHAKIQTYPL